MPSQLRSRMVSIGTVEGMAEGRRLLGDRTVHAWYEGMEIVRYDRARKWYLEPIDPRLARQHVGVHQAVRSALWGVENARGVIYRGAPGGATFDRLVRRLADCCD